MYRDQNGHWITEPSNAPTGGWKFASEAEAMLFALGKLRRLPTGELVRTDSAGTPTSDGLRMVEKIDPYSKRAVYEFSLQPGRNKRDGWMSPFMSPPKIMLGVRNNSPEFEFERVCAERRALYEQLGWVK